MPETLTIASKSPIKFCPIHGTIYRDWCPVCDADFMAMLAQQWEADTRRLDWETTVDRWCMVFVLAVATWIIYCFAR